MNVQPEQKHNSDKMPIDTTSSQPCSKPNVACRFGLSYRWGLSFITWYSNKRNLSLEATLRMGAKWLNFIYGWSPFSKCQRMLFPKRWKLFWLLFLNSPVYLFVVVVCSILQSVIVLYLTIKLLKK